MSHDGCRVDMIFYHVFYRMVDNNRSLWKFFGKPTFSSRRGVLHLIIMMISIFNDGYERPHSNGSTLFHSDIYLNLKCQKF